MTTEHLGNGTTSTPSAGHGHIQQYDIRVQGHLGSRWTAWFDGLCLTNADDGTTVISGPVVDQAALHGVLQKLRDAGIALVSLTQLPPDASITPNDGPTGPTTPEGN